MVTFIVCILKSLSDLEPSDHLNKGEEGYSGAMLDIWVSDALALNITS